MSDTSAEQPATPIAQPIMPPPPPPIEDAPERAELERQAREKAAEIAARLNGAGEPPPVEPSPMAPPATGARNGSAEPAVPMEVERLIHQLVDQRAQQTRAELAQQRQLAMLAAAGVVIAMLIVIRNGRQIAVLAGELGRAGRGVTP